MTAATDIVNYLFLRELCFLWSVFGNLIKLEEFVKKKCCSLKLILFDGHVFLR